MQRGRDASTWQIGGSCRFGSSPAVTFSARSGAFCLTSAARWTLERETWRSAAASAWDLASIEARSVRSPCLVFASSSAIGNHGTLTPASPSRTRTMVRLWRTSARSAATSAVPSGDVRFAKRPAARVGRSLAAETPTTVGVSRTTGRASDRLNLRAGLLDCSLAAGFGSPPGTLQLLSCLP